MVREHLTRAQQAQQRHYNRAAQPREFQPGDLVLVLVPTAACKFLAKWQGPYTVTEKVGPVTYRVRQPGRRKEEQIYHINLLKQWVGTRTQLAALATTTPVVVDVNPHLSAAQKNELQHLVGQFSDVFSLSPGGPRSFTMRSVRPQEPSFGSGPTECQRLGDTPLKRKCGRC